jgi:hypothetical protein
MSCMTAEGRKHGLEIIMGRKTKVCVSKVSSSLVLFDLVWGSQQCYGTM